MRTLVAVAALAIIAGTTFYIVEESNESEFEEGVEEFGDDLEDAID